jgi:long-chain acyl-CoA synthetase
MHSITIGDVLREHRRSFPRQTAVVCGDLRLTYPALDNRVNQVANLLASVGVGVGTRVLWLGENCHRLMEVMLAAAKCGAVVCPANWRGSSSELEFVLADVGPAVIFWQGFPEREPFGEVRARDTSGALWIQYDGTDAASYEHRLASEPDEDRQLDIDPARPLLQIYTAAFAGRPNGALLSQLQIIICSLMQAIDLSIDQRYVYLSCGPMFHLATLQKLFAAFQMGGTNVVTARADPQVICELIDREHVNAAMIVEPTISRIVELNKDGAYDLSSLRTTPARPEWNAMTTPEGDPRLSGGYGQTELGGRLCYPDVDLEGANGRPHCAARVRLLDDDGTEVPTGSIGEISVRGPVVMVAYARRDELNAARSRGGWYRTNDLGRREADGSITFIGPKARMLKSAVENIYPSEVEACIKEHPDVQDVALIGVPDPVWGQSGKAIVVRKDGAMATAEDLIEFCRARMASYKKPRFVEFVTSLPRKGSFIDYDALDAQFGGGGYPGTG